MSSNHLNTPQGKMNAIMAVVVALGIVSFSANVIYGKESATIPFSAEWWKLRKVSLKSIGYIQPGYQQPGYGQPGYFPKPGYGQPGYKPPIPKQIIPGYKPTPAKDLTPVSSKK